MTEIVPKEAEALLTWPGLLQALEAGHRMPPAEIKDMFLYRGRDTLLDRAAWIDGLGALVKVATIFPGNAAKNMPMTCLNPSGPGFGAGILWLT